MDQTFGLFALILRLVLIKLVALPQALSSLRLSSVVNDGYTKGSPLNWKLLKPYRNAVTGSTMVAIQCPHCGEDVELEAEEPGLFDCPYCNKDFAWSGGLTLNDLTVKFLLFLFGIFSPILIFFVSLWIMLAVGDPKGFDEVFYLAISLLTCIGYTLGLAIYGGLTKNKPLLQGVLLSLVASFLIIYIYFENL